MANLGFCCNVVEEVAISCPRLLLVAVIDNGAAGICHKHLVLFFVYFSVAAHQMSHALVVLGGEGIVCLEVVGGRWVWFTDCTASLLEYC